MARPPCSCLNLAKSTVDDIKSLFLPSSAHELLRQVTRARFFLQSSSANATTTSTTSLATQPMKSRAYATRSSVTTHVSSASTAASARTAATAAGATVRREPPASTASQVGNLCHYLEGATGVSYDSGRQLVLLYGGSHLRQKVGKSLLLDSPENEHTLLDKCPLSRL